MKKSFSKVKYQAVFEPNEQGGFNVSFPLFPGAVTYGKNFEHAQKMAEECLDLWIEEMINKKEELPKTNADFILSSVKTRIPA